jgi:hypothetical protein
VQVIIERDEEGGVELGEGGRRGMAGWCWSVSCWTKEVSGWVALDKGGVGLG